MTKGLLALGRITGTQSLTLYEENECLETIEKELRALEIIKKYIYVNKPFESACYIRLNDESEMITEEEFGLLKEVLL